MLVPVQYQQYHLSTSLKVVLDKGIINIGFIYLSGRGVAFVLLVVGLGRREGRVMIEGVDLVSKWGGGEGRGEKGREWQRKEWKRKAG